MTEQVRGRLLTQPLAHPMPDGRVEARFLVETEDGEVMGAVAEGQLAEHMADTMNEGQTVTLTGTISAEATEIGPAR